MARPPLIAVSTGCPAGIGPEVSVAAAWKLREHDAVLVGDLATLRAAARLVGVAPERLVGVGTDATAGALGPAKRGSIRVLEVGPRLAAGDRRPGKPTRRAGAAELHYVSVAHWLVKEHVREGGRGAIVTAPVSKHVIATSGARGAARFVGHTEWLRDLDGAREAVMCFVGGGLATSLVTTHVALSDVPRKIDAAGVSEATLALSELLRRIGKRKPRVAVASLNPHAGEGEMFGKEETRAIVPGITRARRVLGSAANVVGPIGAETAFRKMRAGVYDGVVAMYHDQATIPMKLVAFGDAVNVTMGLSVPRTSVDHGTAYDIAWRGKADAAGMAAALELAARLARARATT
ncbi:MAG TPA: 4-hydroxythreonine-4-phosphate dehydrogenase PdxA [Polyangiaceae bacterium]